MATHALICIDLQRDYFPGGRFPLPGAEAAVKNAENLIKLFRGSNLPVIHVFHVELDPETTFFIPNSDGVPIDPRVAPSDGEIVIEKHFPNAFRETDLLDQIRKLDVTEVVFCGAMSNMCIDASVRAAADAGLKCCVVEDACAASDLQFRGRLIPASQVHAAFMAALSLAYSRVVTFEEFALEHGA